MLCTMLLRFGSAMTRPIRLRAGRIDCGSAAAVRTSKRRWLGLAAKTEPSCKRLGASLRACAAWGLELFVLFWLWPSEMAARRTQALVATAAEVAATLWPR